MKGSLLPALAQLADASHPTERQARAADAILSITPRDDMGYLASAVVQAASESEFTAVESHLEQHRKVLKAKLPEVAEALLTRSESLADSDAIPAFLILLGLVDVMSDDQREKLRGQMRQTVISLGSSSLDPLAELLERAEGEPKFAQDYALLVCEVWDHLKAQPDPSTELFRYVAERFPRLDPDRRGAFITQFGLWLVQVASARLPLSQGLGAIPDLKAGERAGLVERIIGAERIDVDVNTRAGLLLAARQVEGQERSIAARRVQARLQALEGGSPEDQQVLELVTGQNAS
jgi:hypothetical protein